MGRLISLKEKTFDLLCKAVECREIGDFKTAKEIANIYSDMWYQSLASRSFKGKKKIYCSSLVSKEVVEKDVDINCGIVTSDFPEPLGNLSQISEIFFENHYYDTGWALAFNTVERIRERLAFETYVVEKSTLDKMPIIQQGGSVEAVTLKGSTATAGIDLYGQAINITWHMRHDRQIAQFWALMNRLADVMGNTLADVHYSKLVQAGTDNVSNKVTFNGTATSDTQKISLTLNAGVSKLQTTNLEKGFGDLSTVPVLAYVYADDANLDRIVSALRVDPGALAAGGEPLVTYPRTNIQVIPTYDPNIKTLSETKKSILMVLPGKQIMNSYAMNSAGESVSWKTEASQSMSVGHWLAFGANVFDIEQVLIAEMSA